ncbi:MAG: hypothetical protein ABW000_15505 [Actinoplanes sp.]
MQVTITIGRVEVHTPQPPPKPAAVTPEPAAQTPSLSLGDYLNRRTGRDQR